jgi:phage-related protein
MIESFDEGFKELRHEKGAYKERLLFYEPTVSQGTNKLVMLVVFRKQTQKTPKAEINKAKKRMAADIKHRKEEEEKKK